MDYIDHLRLTDRKDYRFDAARVNGHTVKTDVPENAVFTDTVTTVENVLTSDSPTNALSAAMGKELYGMIGGGSSFAPVLLWENSKPTTSFAAQTVAADLTYSWYIISAAISTAAAASSSETLVENNGRIHRLIVCGTQAVNSRTVEIKTTGFVFGAGYSSGQQGNTNVIPLRIYGLK